MTFIQLLYFVTIAENRNFTAAARECRIAQPSLSQQIAKLEDELGYELFDRSGRRITLTDAGRLLLPRAKKILADINETERFFRNGLGEDCGEISVGAIPTMAPYLLPPTVQEFTRRCPTATVHLTEDLTENLLRRLDEKKLDVAILSTPLPTTVSYEVIGRESFFLAVSADSELAELDEIDLADVREVPFILLNQMHCLGQQISTACNIARVAEHIVCESSQLSTIQQFVKMNLGVSLLPEMCAAACDNAGIKYVPVTEGSMGREIAVAWSAGMDKSRVLREFIFALKETLACSNGQL